MANQYKNKIVYNVNNKSKKNNKVNNIDKIKDKSNKEDDKSNKDINPIENNFNFIGKIFSKAYFFL